MLPSLFSFLSRHVWLRALGLCTMSLVRAHTHPSRMHHALGSSCSARGIHDEERMREGQLLKLQLRVLIPFFTHGQKVIQEHTDRKSTGDREWGLRTEWILTRQLHFHLSMREETKPNWYFIETFEMDLFCQFNKG